MSATVHVFPPNQSHSAQIVNNFRDLKRLVKGDAQSIDDALVEYRMLGETVLIFNEEGQPLGLPQDETFPITYSDAPNRDPDVIVLGEQIPYLLGTVVMMTRRDWERVAAG